MIQDTRQQILDVALKLFSARGYFNTSVHDIQREAQISVGSIYHHFNNKETIAKVLFDSIEVKMYSAIRSIIDENETAEERCKEVVRYLFEVTEKHPDMMQYMLYAKHREFMPSEKPVCSSRPFSLMKEIVETGIEAGEIRNIDINVAATSIFGGPIRLIFLRLDGVLDRDLPTYLEESWSCSWNAVAAEQHPEIARTGEI